jgi:predicted alpha/beta-hydrolase family hydrolase
MRRLLAGLAILAAVIGFAAPVTAQTIGVVLMHGNTDLPDGTITLLAAAMEGAGYLVERPEMCWSDRRRRDRPFLECLSELEAPIARLTRRGARAIVVAGMSVGGRSALRSGRHHRARRERVAGAAGTDLSPDRGERRSGTGDGRRRPRR